eukprot:30497-Pelagococcus_subviridis.AAC.34
MACECPTPCPETNVIDQPRARDDVHGVLERLAEEATIQGRRREDEDGRQDDDRGVVPRPLVLRLLPVHRVPVHDLRVRAHEPHLPHRVLEVHLLPLRSREGTGRGRQRGRWREAGLTTRRVVEARDAPSSRVSGTGGDSTRDTCAAVSES